MLSSDATAFGKALRKLRKQAKLSQENLAQKAGLDRTYISLLELGQRSPTLSTMLSISRALEVTLVQLAMAIEASLARGDERHSSQTPSGD